MCPKTGPKGLCGSYIMGNVECKQKEFEMEKHRWVCVQNGAWVLIDSQDWVKQNIWAAVIAREVEC